MLAVYTMLVSRFNTITQAVLLPEVQKVFITLLVLFCDIIIFDNHFQSKVFTSCFSHHKSTVSFLDYDNIEKDIDLQN